MERTRVVAAGFLLSFLALLQLSEVQGWSQHDRVLLRDIQAITLYADRYTNARRSSPIPQLKCVGGSAGCSAMILGAVQCQNKGWDGIDVQWECKVDMDNAYRFGRIEVSCEGFDYPDDPYVLRGSCGLEYTLELTEEGRRKSQNGYGFGGYNSGGSYSKSWDTQSPSYANGAIGFLVILALAYGVYKLFLSGPSMQEQQHHSDYDNIYREASAPPPPGFKSGFTGQTSGFGGYSDSTTFGRHATQGPGFWTGMGTGGVLGYLFGSRRSQPNCTAYSPYHSTWTGPSFSGSQSGFSQNSGVRTTSGFGGTKRR
ncbi:store-operated calcium entry-associated regulatory factor [Hyperolius riggenbachi]|uniref:store-operated calcium entry-associated regulatory factor n=1 Tax=Hyperolius riggenbachi TaxID=752182 RepID=UPI0035A362C5